MLHNPAIPFYFQEMLNCLFSEFQWNLLQPIFLAAGTRCNNSLSKNLFACFLVGSLHNYFKSATSGDPPTLKRWTVPSKIFVMLNTLNESLPTSSAQRRAILACLLFCTCNVFLHLWQIVLLSRPRSVLKYTAHIQSQFSRAEISVAWCLLMHSMLLFKINLNIPHSFLSVFSGCFATKDLRQWTLVDNQHCVHEEAPRGDTDG